MRALIATLGACAFSISAAQAATIYDDRSAFEAAVSIAETQDFTGESGRLPNPRLLGDVSYISSDDSGLFFEEALFGLSGGFLYAGNTGFIRMEVAAGHTAFGLDVSDLFSGTNSFAYQVYDASAGVIASGSFLRNNAFGFFGVTSDGADIRTVDIQSIGDYEAIDNVVLGTALDAQVPVPAALPLLGLAAAGLAMVGGRRRAV